MRQLELLLLFIQFIDCDGHKFAHKMSIKCKSYKKVNQNIKKA